MDLKQYRNADSMTEVLKRELSEWEEREKKLLPSDERIQPALDTIADIKRNIEEQIDKQLSIKAEILKAISSTDPLFKEILYRRYVLGQTFEKIAAGIGYSYKHTFCLHKKAVQSLNQQTQQ